MPSHGKFARILARDENGFIGSGLDDLSWGAYTDAVDSAYFEVEIDSELGGTAGVDTFRWREDGGAWTEDVDITGAAQALAGAGGDQALAFAATTGHALGDKWVIGNLFEEACTINGLTAQITDAARRLLDPNAMPVFVDDGGANVLSIDPARGTATFDAEPTDVVATGDGGYVPAAALFAVGYMYDWQLSAAVKLSDAGSFGDHWDKFLASTGGATGSADGYFNTRKWFDRMTASAETYFLAKLFSYDPDADASGDHFIAWLQFTGYNLAAPKSDIVKEKISYTIEGAPYFIANS